MNSEHSKLKQEQRQEQEQSFGEQVAQTSGQEFATVEELLRYDNEQNPVPAQVGGRLNASVSAEPKPSRPWYKNLFRR